MERIVIKLILKSKNKNFTNIKVLFQLKRIDINKIVVSNKVSFGKKGFRYFIGYKDVKKNRPLCVFLPKMSAYKKTLMKLNIYLF